uniref:Serine protease 56 n=1 Tax=Amazona collaria TaxID=241587 RepID=A0A8B9F8V7_9PSIT
MHKKRWQCQVSPHHPPPHADGRPGPTAACWAGGQRLASAAAGPRGAPKEGCPGNGAAGSPFSPPLCPPGSCGHRGVPQANTTAPRGRIMGGSVALLGSWPWLVSVRLHGELMCGGVLVGLSWVLTAAHCFLAWTVVVGDHELGKPGAVEVGTPLTSLCMPHSPVCLPSSSSEPSPGTACYIAGWGSLYEGRCHPNTHGVCGALFGALSGAWHGAGALSQGRGLQKRWGCPGMEDTIMGASPSRRASSQRGDGGTGASTQPGDMPGCSGQGPDHQHHVLCWVLVRGHRFLPGNAHG